MHAYSISSAPIERKASSKSSYVLSSSLKPISAVELARNRRSVIDIQRMYGNRCVRRMVMRPRQQSGRYRASDDRLPESKPLLSTSYFPTGVGDLSTSRHLRRETAHVGMMNGPQVHQFRVDARSPIARSQMTPRKVIDIQKTKVVVARLIRILGQMHAKSRAMIRRESVNRLLVSLLTLFLSILGRKSQNRAVSDLVKSLQRLEVLTFWAEAQYSPERTGTRKQRREWGLREASRSFRVRMVALIKRSRNALEVLFPAMSGVAGSLVLLTKGYFYRLLNEYTPYYAQKWNVNLLRKGKKKARAITCNLTTLAMILNALGMSQSDFKGDKKLLTHISTCLSFPGKSGVAPKSFAELARLRMPDFLQYVAVYATYEVLRKRLSSYRCTKNMCSDRRVCQHALGARKQAAQLVASSAKLWKWVAAKFGVKEVAFTDKRGTRWARSVLGFRQRITKALEGWLRQGAQVLVGRPGHIVRLQDFDNDKVVFDDPSFGGKNTTLTWEQAFRAFNKRGYFTYFHVYDKGN